MSKVDPRNLDEYSAEAAAKIFASYPEWRSLAAAEEGMLVIRVPCPIDGRPELVINTDDEELTLSYDRWHSHFEDWSEGSREMLYCDAYACARAILSEEIVVAVHMSGTRWSGSRLLNAGEEPPEPGVGQTVYVRSWLGTYDAEKSAPNE